MQNLTRRSFVSNLAKASLLAAIPVSAAQGHPYVLTLTDGFEGPVLARMEFFGDEIPVDPSDYLPTSKAGNVHAVVTGASDGYDRLASFAFGQTFCHKRACELAELDWRDTNYWLQCRRVVKSDDSYWIFARKYRQDFCVTGPNVPFWED